MISPSTTQKFSPKLQAAYEKVLSLKGETLRLEVQVGETKAAFQRAGQELDLARKKEYEAFGAFSKEHAAELKRRGI